MFQQNKDYTVPLLHILAEFGERPVPVTHVYQVFEQRYSALIPPEHHDTRKNGMVIWQHIVGWRRYELQERLGFIASPGRGKWAITQAGRDWLSRNPTAQHIDLPARTSDSPTRKQTASARRSAPSPTSPGITLEILEKTRQAMGDEQFRPVWGTIYDQLIAAERAKAITNVNDNELTRSARRQVRQIQDYLQGRNGDRPNSEQICDWIHFCYQFSLFREAVALFPLVNAREVDTWYFERARRIVMTTKVK